MVSPKIRTTLWARAAGRCQYQGCNRSLIGDLVSGRDKLNAGYVAHIASEDPDGPRGDPIRSPLLANDVPNLMLMCDPHHRVIDVEAVAEHPEDVLLAMKARHETRIEAVTAIQDERRSHVLLYGARIGDHDYPVRFDLAKAAVLPGGYPAEPPAIQLDLVRLDFDDSEPRYWDIQRDNLRRQFDRKVKDRLRAGEIGHLSLFALAPQPLLVELGRLLSDIAGVAVHQLHREPQGWDWRNARPPLELATTESMSRGERVALKLALSATITDDRITAVLGEGAAIWALTTPQPHNDIMHSAEDLAGFRRALRGLLGRIKAQHGEDAVMHVFPALPVSAAIELGRVWMPKADLPLVVYDQRRETGFAPRMWIGAL
jgi:hypothetical protein